MKKELEKTTILFEEIDILCMEETELNKNLDHNLLSFPGYAIETEVDKENSRAAFYISNIINYVRRIELKGQDSNLLIIDLESSSKCRIIMQACTTTSQNI